MAMPEIASLPLFHQIAGQSVLVLGDGAAAEPKRRLIERAGGVVIDDIQRAIDQGVRLAFVAYDDAKACETAAINLRCAGLIVNVVDRPDLCDFTTPSILDRDPLLIAVGTGGASAGLAKHVRLRLERILPQTLGLLAKALKSARPLLKERLPDGTERRRAIDRALHEGGALDPFDESSHVKVEQWSTSELSADQGGTWMFTLESEDPDDLSVKQARLLGVADAVCSHGTVSSAILGRARADAVRIQCDTAACPMARQLSAKTGGPDDDPPRPSCPKARLILDERAATVILRAR